VRRLRSALRTFAPALDRAWAKEERKRLRAFSDELSAARDADIVLERARADVASLTAADAIAADGVFSALIAARNDAYAKLRETRSRPIHASLLRELTAVAERPAVLEPQARAADIVAPIVRRAYKRLRKCVRRSSKPPSDSELHAIRIAAKHLRYALEACASIEGRRAKRAARRVEQLQDVLGEEHDAAYAFGRLREIQAGPGAAFVSGEIARIEQEAAERARSRWRRAWRRVKEGS
jgi:CHAD domain-containing protein